MSAAFDFVPSAFRQLRDQLPSAERGEAPLYLRASEAGIDFLVELRTISDDMPFGAQIPNATLDASALRISTGSQRCQLRMSDNNLRSQVK